jgi:hypothetical protein
MGQRYLQEASAVYENYRKLFPSYHFSFRYPAHFVVYPDRASYLKFEKVDPRVAGHAFSQRLSFQRFIETERGLELEEELRPNTKLQRLAFYAPGSEDPNQTTFAHELVHLFNWDMLNQGIADAREIRPNLFLNEGLAEYFAVLDDPFQHALRIAPLKEWTGAIPLKEWLEATDYPDPEMRRLFYSEAYLFSRWVIENSNAPGKIFASLFLREKASEVEASLRAGSGIHFQNYLSYRDNMLRAHGQ